jgi:hypothetical protein
MTQGGKFIKGVKDTIYTKNTKQGKGKCQLKTVSLGGKVQTNIGIPDIRSFFAPPPRERDKQKYHFRKRRRIIFGIGKRKGQKYTF